MQLLQKDSQKRCVSESLYVNSLAKASVPFSLTCFYFSWNFIELKVL